MKFQQYTGPVQAKGLEDTAFFRYNLLLSLNEVGSDVERFGRTVEEFHESNAERLRDCPFEMTATATHDTKLGEDTRARINVLSEIPDEWAREVTRWMRLNSAHRTLVDGEPAPDRNDEYRFYQALVGDLAARVDAAGGRGNGSAPSPGALLAPCDFIERIRAYMLKSVKEAKRHTSWLTPNEEYEQAVARFVERVLSGPGGARFLPAFAPVRQPRHACRHDQRAGAGGAQDRRHRASPISIRARSCGISASSIPTTGGRSTSISAGASSTTLENVLACHRRIAPPRSRRWWRTGRTAGSRCS